MADSKDLTGKCFGRWTVLRQADNVSDRNVWWECVCDCGTQRAVVGISLRANRSKGCGCQRSEIASDRMKKLNTTHGLSSHPLFGIWYGMIDRCGNPSDTAYHNYGGRGIKVCDRWKGEDGFKNFVADMGDRPSSSHSIERIQNSGNYEPQNSRWATPSEQARNQRSNRMIEFNGMTRCLSDWGRLTGLGAKVIDARLRMGWTIERALTEPARRLSRTQSKSS